MATRRPKGFTPIFTITVGIANDLMRIEAVRQSIQDLPITPRVLANLRETARLFSTHYSTMIEGNRLTQQQVAQVITNGQQFPGRERDQEEVLGYYAGLDEVERLVKAGGPITEASLQRLHGLVMSAGKKRIKATPYRDGQNVIRDSRTQTIVYMPPEAKDVPQLMSGLIEWINQEDELPIPIKASIAHYQYATIHPYYDGNGRTARLLTTLVLHLHGYGLKGLYALEEYYARQLQDYYEALTVGPSHNYHIGRAEADITKWLSYFVRGMAVSFQNVEEQARAEAERGSGDQTRTLRKLDARQRKALTLFVEAEEITGEQIAVLFGLKARAAAVLAQGWVKGGFLAMSNTSKKSRRYRLTPEYEAVLEG